MSSLVKVIEVMAESDKSWEDAAHTAIRIASKTVRNVKSIWVDNFSATVENGKIVKYRVDGKISFLIEGT
jgi:flavin-binding protein dodecin